ncbi:UDPGT domain-containing protein [Cephalotus follicularis]|uniref:UDPGT domain-containing protein n=1 Tax=Cephalotus follicularis TaxID=3775 RepID=A0A1Q3C2N6_CEPFO|nr:UDPGT domain-containing protein [Cephalotus follicularis]
MATPGGQRVRQRLVLVVFPVQSHITSMLQLATILHSKGFSITIVHPLLNSPNSSNHPEFTFVPISDNMAETKLVSPSYFISVLNKNCVRPFEECMDQMLQTEEQHDRITCIIYDALTYFAQDVADSFKLAGINVRTSNAASMLAYAVVRRPDDQGYIFFPDCMPEETSVIQSLNLKDIIQSMPQKERDVMVEQRAALIALTDSVKKASAIIVNTMDFLEQEIVMKTQEHFSTTIFTIGPFHKLAPTISSTSILEEDATCISWLNKQVPKSVIYVSFGSVAKMNENELLETAWGLANSEQPFLWVVRPGLVRDVDWLDLLPKGFAERIGERGCIVKWAPQKEVLAHVAVGGFWSHCGWNSTLESICEGIPMLCRPFFGDQLLNVRYVCDVWKVGLELESELDRVKIVRAVRRLMVDTEGEDIRQRAMEFKKKVDHCLRESGSSLNGLNELAEKILSV